jgi:uncharacterized protein YdeI (BOF family)
MRIESSTLSFSALHEEVQNSQSIVFTSSNQQVTTATSVQELERLSLSAQGNVQLQNGNAIAVSMEGFLGRYDAYQLTLTQSASMMDPLVVNLKGALAQIDDTETFSFDLDSDGVQEEMSMLQKNNGFLALDQNGNGVIDDGSELFGTQSGDGFADLAVFDDDGNGWIDENDAIFSQLKIWQKSAMQDNLISLSQAHVGALLLENAHGTFTYKNNAETNASLQSSSVVLFENGRSGWMSHVDFARKELSQTVGVSQSNAEEDKAPNNLLSRAGQAWLSKQKTTQSTNDNTLESLQTRLKMLQDKLSKTKDPDEKTGIVMQILKILAQMMQLGGH